MTKPFGERITYMAKSAAVRDGAISDETRNTRYTGQLWPALAGMAGDAANCCGAC
jgi:hypothetical protein